MTFLPIIERELRVRARSRSAYRLRFAVALVGALICLPQFLAPGPFGVSATMGHRVFDVIVISAFTLCCAACLVTADAISAERREGTLVLLLLTRVRSLDLLLGKLGSTGLASVCALVTLLPMLMIPVLSGGVTGGEAIRKGLVLVNTLFLSLAAGLWASASQQERSRGFTRALLLMVSIMLVPVIGSGMLVPSFSPWPDSNLPLVLLSPVSSLIGAGSAYSASPSRYWVSLAAGHGLAWLLLSRAGVLLGRAEVEPGSALGAQNTSSGRSSRDRPLAQGDTCGSRRHNFFPRFSTLRYSSPIECLVLRQRGVKAAIWACSLVGAAYYGANVIYFRFGVVRASWSYPYIQLLLWPLSLAVAVVGSSFLAWAASRFFVQAGRTGESEMLLTTPLGAQRIVLDQWRALKRLLLWPVIILCVSYLLPSLFRGGRMGYGFHLAVPDALHLVLGVANTVAGVGAVCWLAMWFGFKTSNQTKAILWTVGLAKGIAFLITVLIQFSWPIAAGYGLSPSLISVMLSWPPQLATLYLYLRMIRWAKNRLLTSELSVPRLIPLRAGQDFRLKTHPAPSGTRL